VVASTKAWLSDPGTDSILKKGVPKNTKKAPKTISALQIRRNFIREAEELGHAPKKEMEWSYGKVGGFRHQAESYFCKLCGIGGVIRFRPEQGAKHFMGKGMIKENCSGNSNNE